MQIEALAQHPRVVGQQEIVEHQVQHNASDLGEGDDIILHMGYAHANMSMREPRKNNIVRVAAGAGERSRFYVVGVNI